MLAFEFLKKYKIPVASYKVLKTDGEVSSLATPCVLKVPSILHKTEKGAVKIVRCKEELASTYCSLVKLGEVIWQPLVEGKEVIIGVKDDPTFGPVLMFGLGGIFTEVYKDVSFRVCPITNKDAEAMISEIKAYPVLKGVRGQKPINFKLLKDVLVKVGKLATKEKIKELDINPFMINDKSGCAVDVRVIR